MLCLYGYEETVHSFTELAARKVRVRPTTYCVFLNVETSEVNLKSCKLEIRVSLIKLNNAFYFIVVLYKIKMARKMLILLIAVISVVRGEEDLKDFDFATSGVGQEKEMMIAQESRQYQTMVKAPIRIVKPIGITNSHRPQYNLDSFEDDYIEKKYRGNEADELIDFFEEPTTKRSVEKDYKQNFKFRSKEAMIRDAVLRALERKDHVGKFAQILPIIRAMSGSQRIALASLVASQVTTPPGRSPLNLAQVCHRLIFIKNSFHTTKLKNHC